MTVRRRWSSAVEAVALDRRRAPLGAGGVVGRVVLRVLDVDVVDLRDRRDAEGVEVDPGVRRVALEVAPEGPVLLGAGDLVVREGEVVHPDVDVARRGEALDPRDEDRELLRPLREVGREDPLRLLQPRDVGVGVHRDPVGAERQDLLDARRAKPSSRWPGRP